jgi:serine protease
MDDQQVQRGGVLGRYMWLLVILAIVVLWWYFRPNASHKVDQIGGAEAAAATMPDEILVDLVDDVTPEQIAKLEREVGIRLELADQSGEAESTKLYIAHVDPSVSRDDLIEQLRKRPEVEIAEPDAMMSLAPGEESVVVEASPAYEGFPNDPMYAKQWNLRQIGMPEAWKLAQGNGVVVAVLDTGVAYENYDRFHLLPDLVGITFVDPYNFIANTKHADDDHGHGSHVTGTIAQATNNGIGVAGVALDVKIMPLKVLSGSGSGSIPGIADAIRYAADHGAKVINMSLGGAFPSNVLKKAVKYAHDKGVTIVCAAGNDGRGKVGYPAAYPGAIAVAATQQDEATTFYSNYGKDIDIAAPGGNTMSDDGGRNNPDGGILQNTIMIENGRSDPTRDAYLAFMGTSMASPHVAGVAALVVGEGVTDPDMVEKILKDSARKPHDHEYSTERYGAGIMDAPAAIKKVRTETGGWQLALGFVMAGAVAVTARRRIKLGLAYVGGVVVGASGLFFLPSVAPSLSSATGIHALTHGLPSWGNGCTLLFSALVPLVLLAVGYGVPKLRVLAAGIAVGIAAHLAFFAVVPMAAHSSLWLGANALASLAIARLAVRR